MIKKWREFLLKEDAFNREKYNDYNFKAFSKKKESDLNIKRKFDEIKDLLKNINYHDIILKFSENFNKKIKNDDNTLKDIIYLRVYNIIWPNNINDKINELSNMLLDDETEKILDDKKNKSFNPFIAIEYKNFNRFHWIENHEIPNSIKRIGLGYKTYKKVIDMFNYISSADDSTDDASRIWGDLLLDEELFCAVNIDSYLIYSKKYCTNEKREEVKKNLLDFFSKNTNFIEKKTGIDDEFLEYLQLTEDDEILWKVKEISL